MVGVGSMLLEGRACRRAHNSPGLEAWGLGSRDKEPQRPEPKVQEIGEHRVTHVSKSIFRPHSLVFPWGYYLHTDAASSSWTTISILWK